MQVQGQSEQGFIKLKISYPRTGNLSYNFKLVISVSLNGQNAEMLNKTLLIPQKNISIGPFPGGKIYKVTCTGLISSQETVKTIFVFVSSWENSSEADNNVAEEQLEFYPIQQKPASREKPQAKKAQTAFSNSQDLMKMVGKSVGITSDKILDRYILNGRNCRTTKQFIGKRNSDSMKKKQMVLKGKLILNEVYKQREGMQFFKNDWFMGPFYSYNHNQKKLAE